MIPGLQTLTYEGRLRRLNLPTLAYRRLRGSMIETYKSLNVYDNAITPTLTKSTSRTTRGNNQKLATIRCKKSHPKQHSFNVRVVAPNSLPNEVVCSPNVNTFKARLDSWWKHQSIKFNYEASLSLQPPPHSRSQPSDLDTEAQ